MDVQEWRDTLDWLTHPEGWIGRRDSKAERAYAVLAGYEQENGWIAHGLPARKEYQLDGKVSAVKPDEAYAAELQRDAIFQLAALHELRRWDMRSPPQRGDTPAPIEILKQRLVRAALVAAMGLRAKSVQAPRTGPYAEVDFAHGGSATQFFEAVVRPRLMRLDAGLGLADHVPPGYEPHADELIEQWGRVWTAGVALTHLDWASVRKCGTARDVARAIWCERDPDGKVLSSFRPSPALIPTERKLVLKVHAEVRTRAALTYAFVGDENLRKLQADQPSTFQLALRALSDARRVGEDKFYDGYNRAHLYLSVWADCLHVANGAPGMPHGDPPPTTQPQGDAEFPDTYAAEQRAALREMKATRRQVAAMRKAMRGGQRFHPGPTGAGAAAAAATGLEPISQGSLRLLLAHAVPGARWQPVASIDLWRELGPDLDWIDILVVARTGDTQQALPLAIDDEVDDGADDETGRGRSLLVLDEGADPPVRADVLRSALRAPDALVGIVVRRSRGAFVVLEIELDAQPDDAG